jgi:hypothetical protein
MSYQLSAISYQRCSSAFIGARQAPLIADN